MPSSSLLHSVHASPFLVIGIQKVLAESVAEF